jgi:tetratricopeptide (TPR) repeat protein
MEGQWKLLVCTAMIAGAFGCTRKETVSPSPFGMREESKGFSLLPSAKPKTAQDFAPPPPKASAKGEAPSADSIAAWADVQADAAFMEERSTPDRDRMIDSSRQIYQKALAVDPKNKTALTGLANLYARTGDRERAVEMLEAAISHHPKDHQLAHKLAAIHIRFQDWARAQEACQYALTVDPENRTYRKTLGYCQAQQDDWQQAGETLMQVMTESKTRYFLGRVLIDQHRFEEAKQQIELSLQLDPNDEQAKYVLADIVAGRVMPTPNDPNPVMQAGFEQP